MLSRMLPCLLMLVLALGGGPLFTPTVGAQTPSDDLKPNITDVQPSAFQAKIEANSAAASVPTLQTGALAAAETFSDMLIRWQPPATLWQPPSLIQSILKLEVRVSKDNQRWTGWTSVEFEYELNRPDDPPGVLSSGIIYAGEARLYQLRITPVSGTVPADFELGNMEVHTVDTRIPDETTPQPQLHPELGGGKLGIASASIPRPAFVSRTQWGNPQGENAPNALPRYRTATHLVVHHTAESNTLGAHEPNWAARVRAIWSFHTYSLDWGDIGYNWLIDPNGVIYAGRAGSTSLTDDAVGFHDTANFGSMGVSVIGTYTSVPPTAAAQASLVNLLAWKASQRNINPLDSSFYYGCSI